MPKSITLGGLFFASKAEAEQHIRAILGRYSNMAEVVGEDLKFIWAIINSRSPERRAALVDCGVRRIVVQHLNDRHNSRRFLVIRTDSSIRDFTWHGALYPSTARSRVMSACRFAVADQIVEFRNRAFSKQPVQACVVCGKPISASNCDIDHIPPQTFQHLVESWLKSNGMVAEDVGLIPSRGYQQPDEWEDFFLEENWKDYHRMHARLRAIHPFANRSIVRKKDYATANS